MKKQVQRWGIAMIALSVGLVQVVVAADPKANQQHSQTQLSKSAKTMTGNHNAHFQELVHVNIHTHSGDMVSAYIPMKEVKKLPHKAQKDLYWFGSSWGGAISSGFSSATHALGTAVGAVSGGVQSALGSVGQAAVAVGNGIKSMGTVFKAGVDGAVDAGAVLANAVKNAGEAALSGTDAFLKVFPAGTKVLAHGVTSTVQSLASGGIALSADIKQGTDTVMAGTRFVTLQAGNLSQSTIDYLGGNISSAMEQTAGPIMDIVKRSYGQIQTGLKQAGLYTVKEIKAHPQIAAMVIALAILPLCPEAEPLVGEELIDATIDAGAEGAAQATGDDLIGSTATDIFAEPIYDGAASVPDSFDITDVPVDNGGMLQSYDAPDVATVPGTGGSTPIPYAASDAASDAAGDAGDAGGTAAGDEGGTGSASNLETGPNKNIVGSHKVMTSVKPSTPVTLPD